MQMLSVLNTFHCLVRKMLAADNIKVLSLSNNSHCNCNSTTVPHCFSLSSYRVIVPWLQHCTVLMKLTVAVLHFIRLLFYITRQLSTSNFSSILPMQPLTGYPGCQRFFSCWGWQNWAAKPGRQVAPCRWRARRPLASRVLTRQIVTLKNIFTWSLETKITSFVNWLPL